MTKTKTLVAITLFAATLATATPALAKNEGTWATISDIGLYGLTAVAIGTPIVKHDRQGAFQAAGSIAAAQLVTIGLKESFPELRPDGSDRKSFPSGHTSQSFAAAATLFNRQGVAVGIPAFAIASLVGVARVQADKHFYYDVIVGAAIGTASGFLITHQRPNRSVAFAPWGDSKGGGLNLSMHF
jgi:membrane-associated phospholipid phosphatase